MQETFFQIFGTFALVMLVAALVGFLGLLLMIRSMRHMRVPPNAGFFTTLRYVPLGLVILLDLLDFGLDFLAAPISWVILDRMNLNGLRDKAAVEALIPFTGAIPVFTIAWFATRMFELGVVDTYYARPERVPRRPLPSAAPEVRRRSPARRPRVIDMD